MKTNDFDYYLPPEQIAQTPVDPRDSSRLLVLNRETGSLQHRTFDEIGEYLNAGDLLVLNQTRVISARIFARKQTGGRIELLLLHRVDRQLWECLVGGKGMNAGVHLQVEEKGPKAEIVKVLDGARRLVRFDKPIELYLPRLGHVPLPPYIHEPLKDPERYQTVYARDPGSAAAPTAGLHFTAHLLENLRLQGVKLAYVTLHVGLDTFAPVTELDPKDHLIHTEWCNLPQETADTIRSTRQSGGRVIAVGTTSVRTLESAAAQMGNAERFPKEPDLSTIVSRPRFTVQPFNGNTSIYMLPGYDFRVVDAMITNFHLPMSTLIMLVSAFAGRDTILHAYQVAIQEKYRFYSFGDAMFIL